MLIIQVGINVLGVVENMSGLSQRASALSFVTRGPGSRQAGETDVTEEARRLLKEHFGQVGMSAILTYVVFLCHTF